MARRNRNTEQPLNSTLLWSAIIGAIATVVAAAISYSAGVNATKIPIQASQTAAAAAPAIINTVVVTESALDGATSESPLLQGIALAVDSQQGWQSAGLVVHANDIVSVEVVGGAWTGWRDNDSKEFVWTENSGYGFSSYILCGQGSNYVSDCPMENANVTALVAKIGTSRYEIGIGCTFRSLENGVLEFTINDDGHFDNFGVLAVKVSKNEARVIDEDNCGSLSS